MPEIITAQIKEEMAKELNEFMEIYGVDRSTAIRKLLEKGLDEWKIERAISEYRDGKISLMRASEIAGVSIWEFLDELEEKDISINISWDTIEESLGI